MVSRLSVPYGPEGRRTMANNGGGSCSGGGSRTRWVAIVDDDASVRTALARRLRAENLPVQTFASAQEYLAAAGEGRVACLVLDVHLGTMSGFELHDLLRGAGATVPVILITAHDEIPSTELARYAGPNGYLRKPFDSDELVALVRRALQRVA
jgi:FixJ family two-component response regulator